MAEASQEVVNKFCVAWSVASMEQQKQYAIGLSGIVDRDRTACERPNYNDIVASFLCGTAAAGI